ncbi:MAG: serine--tRNA ligase [Candidatus Bipolaricaulota bacterium]
MLDIRKLREDPDGATARLRRRDPDIDLSPVLDADERRRSLLQQVEGLRRRKNDGSEDVARLQAEGRQQEAEHAVQALRQVSQELKSAEEKLGATEAQLEELLLALPNMPLDEVPDGAKDRKVVMRTWGEPGPADFQPRHHMELASELKLLDMKRGASLAGSRFPMYTGLGARLEMALVMWMFELQVSEHGYIPLLPPFLANSTSMRVSGQIPKFEDELYFCERDGLYLNPTAESLLVNVHRDEILQAEHLPLRYVAYTPCFRREAGSYGEEQRGLIRVHQFNKVELFHYEIPERSPEALSDLLYHAERVLQELGLHYRAALLTAQDLAHQSAKTVDLEVWLPGQGRYYEVSSCSDCGTFQARRGRIRYRDVDSGKPRFVSTLNGSGLATSRLFAAILEQGQREDGKVNLPPVLSRRLGVEVLE